MYQINSQQQGLRAPCPCLFSNQSFVILVFQPKPNWIQWLQQLPVIFQPGALVFTGATANSERLSLRLLILVFKLSALIHLHPRSGTFGNVHFPAAGMSAEIQFLSVHTTSESLKLETPLQCRHSDIEPLLYTSDPYINTSLSSQFRRDNSEAPTSVFTLQTFIPFFHRPPQTPLSVPHPVLKSCKKTTGAQLDSISVYVCVFV